MDIKPLPKVPLLPTSIGDNELGFIRALFAQLSVIDRTVNELITVTQPETLTDLLGKNNSIYFSSTQNKLVYKDQGGTVHALY